MKKEKTSVVKIDPSLLERIEKFIQKEENKYRFVSKKQVIDLAVYEFLNKIEKENHENEKQKK